jgi:hypothetical protein
MQSFLYDPENPCCICLSHFYISQTNDSPKYNEIVIVMENKQIDKSIKKTLRFCDLCLEKHQIKKMSRNDVTNKLVHPKIKLQFIREMNKLPNKVKNKAI